jgi:hypothetical protein
VSDESRICPFCGREFMWGMMNSVADGYGVCSKGVVAIECECGATWARDEDVEDEASEQAGD